MHEGRWTERRLAGQAEVQEGRTLRAERHAVGSRQLHEQIVRMLAIDEVRRAVRRLAGLEQQRIAALALGRVERKHGAQAEPARPERPLAHQHQHALAEGLVVAARAGLLVIDEVDEAMRHERPVAHRLVHARHRRGVGLPRGARAFAGHRVGTEGTLHVHPRVLVRRRRFRRRLVVLRHVVPGRAVLVRRVRGGGRRGRRGLRNGMTRCRGQPGDEDERKGRSEQVRGRCARARHTPPRDK